MYYQRLTRFLIILLASGLSSLSSFGQTYEPTTVQELKDAIDDANTNDEDDIIDLGGQTFTLDTVDNGDNGLPVILTDNAHTLLIRNGTIERDSGGLIPNFRFFELDTGADFSLESVILRNGEVSGDGGAILVNDGATISSIKLSQFLDNDADGGSGGAIALLPNSIIDMICDTTFDNNTATTNGGAISVLDSTINIIMSSTFSRNGGNNGGAIAIVAESSANSTINSIRNSTISNNDASVNGGGLYLLGTPNIASIGTLSNSTIADNDADGGDGGGIYLGNDFSIIGNLFSSIVALNTADGEGPDIFDEINMVSIVDENFNLIGDNSQSQISDPSGNNGNSKVGTSGSPIDPLLDPLADNGGPTQTRAEQDGSPAIDMGSNSLLDLLYDQRGPLFLRTRGAGTDIGAYEVQNCDKNLGDADGDGICGDVDLCPNDPENLCDPGDADGDGIQNFEDNCPGKANPGQEDRDSDGMGDVCDYCPDDDTNTCQDDDDGDLIPNAADNCPDVSNQDQADFDGDGIGDACDTCTDSDRDGVGDIGFDDTTCPEDTGPDNCQFKANTDQANADGDEYGDICDPCPNDPDNLCNPDDVDDDGILNTNDNCPGKYNPGQEDEDSDGMGDVCDLCPTDATNSCDAGDIDEDGIQNYLDNCIAIANPDQRDTDGDGIGDKCDVCQAGNNLEDSDGDGVCDTSDRCPGGDDAKDSDYDGIPDFCDNCVHKKNFDQTDCDQDGIGDACDDDECVDEPIIHHPDPIVAAPVPVPVPPPPPPVPYPWISPVAAVTPAPGPVAPLGPILEAPKADANIDEVAMLTEEDPIEVFPEYYDAESAALLPEEPMEKTSAGCSQMGGSGQGINNMWLFMLLFLGAFRRMFMVKTRN